MPKTGLINYDMTVCVCSQWQVYSLQWVYLSSSHLLCTAMQSLLRWMTFDSVFLCPSPVMSLHCYSPHCQRPLIASSPSTGMLFTGTPLTGTLFTGRLSTGMLFTGTLSLSLVNQCSQTVLVQSSLSATVDCIIIFHRYALQWYTLQRYAFHRYTFYR